MHAGGSTGARKTKKNSADVNAKKYLGIHSRLTRRHRANGTTSKNAKNNVSITVGNMQPAHIPAIHKVYGKKCEAALCSVRRGTCRVAVCDCNGARGHDTEDTAAHDLPKLSGPYDKGNWKEVVRLTNIALKSAGEK